jgi:hypothetical protein
MRASTFLQLTMNGARYQRSNRVAFRAEVDGIIGVYKSTIGQIAAIKECFARGLEVFIFDLREYLFDVFAEKICIFLDFVEPRDNVLCKLGRSREVTEKLARDSG